MLNCNNRYNINCYETQAETDTSKAGTMPSSNSCFVGIGISDLIIY